MPRAARTGSPGTRWMIRKAAATSTHTETSSRPTRRAANRTHGSSAGPVQGRRVVAVLLVTVRPSLPISAQHPDRSRGHAALAELEDGALAERRNRGVDER